MFSLTTREQTLLVVVLAATLLGAAAKHWREVRRERLAAAATAHAHPESGAANAIHARTRRQTVPPAEPLPTPQVALAEEAAGR